MTIDILFHSFIYIYSFILHIPLFQNIHIKYVEFLKMDENESLFSATEEELFKKIKRVYNSINRRLADETDEFSNLSTISLSDDGLSEVSDISSIASFKFTKKKEFRTPQPRKSRIPVFSGKRKKIDEFYSPQLKKVKNKDVDIYSQKNRKHDNELYSSKYMNKINEPKQFGRKNSDNQDLVIHNYSLDSNQQPHNFLAPDVSEFSRACICIFEGADFPRARNGERSTYVVIHLHPDIISIKSPISFNRTKNAIYNGGFDINCAGLDFTNVVPLISVYDYISENESELLGVAFIELHISKKIDDVLIVLQDEWIDIFSIDKKTKTGKVKVTLIFHNDDDVSDYIHKPDYSIGKSVDHRKLYNECPRVDQAVQGDLDIKPKMQSLGIQAEIPLPSFDFYDNYDNSKKNKKKFKVHNDLENTNDESNFSTLSLTTKDMDMNLNAFEAEPSSSSIPKRFEISEMPHKFADESALDTMKSTTEYNHTSDSYDETDNFHAPVYFSQNKKLMNKFTGYADFNFMKK